MFILSRTEIKVNRNQGMSGMACGVCVPTLHIGVGWRGEIINAQNNVQYNFKSRFMLQKTYKCQGTPKCNLWKYSLHFRIWKDVRHRPELDLSKHTHHKKGLLGSKSTPKLDIIEGNLISKHKNKRTACYYHCKCNYPSLSPVELWTENPIECWSAPHRHQSSTERQRCCKRQQVKSSPKGRISNSTIINMQVNQTP